MRGKNYMQIARALIRDLEILNRVSFGRESCDIVFKHIQDRDNTWIAEIEKVERELSELTLLLYDYLGTGTVTHRQLIDILKAEVED